MTSSGGVVALVQRDPISSRYPSVAGQPICPAQFHPRPDRAAADFAFVLVGGRRIRSLSEARQARAAHHGLARTRQPEASIGELRKQAEGFGQ
jgi:hypothetical protein